MSKHKILYFVGLGLILYVSINFSSPLRDHVLGFSNHIKKNLVSFVDKVHSEINTFFNQKEKILSLQKQLQKSEKTAQLSVAFAAKLNHFLDESKLQHYDPDLYFSQVISYVKLGDYTKLWIDFPGFKPNLIYGLLYKGYAAGIVENQDGRPMARLLGDPQMMFSVVIGKEKYLGVLFGNSPNLDVKYIPTYATVKKGDEVTTGGNDNIFFEGIKVGKVIRVESNNLYKSAIVKPYATIKNPDFFYVVDVNTKYIKELNTSVISDALK